jgi:hypothetical protein
MLKRGFAIALILSTVFVTVSVMRCDLGTLMTEDLEDDALREAILAVVMEWHDAQAAGASQQDLDRIMARQKALLDRRANHVRGQALPDALTGRGSP